MWLRRASHTAVTGAVAVAALIVGPGAVAQEFRPYPQFNITVEQWQRYFDEVSQKLADAAQPRPSEQLIVFNDRAGRAVYAFTAPGHPAHPAWITKRVVRVDNAVGVQQVGYFAGDQTAFGAWFRSYGSMPSE